MVYGTYGERMAEEKKPGQPKKGAGKKSTKKAAAAAQSGATDPTLNAAPEADAPAEPTAKNVNPIVLDETYHGLREDNRVVMRRTIAINLDNFRAAPDNFDPRPVRNYPTLPPVDAPFFSVVVPTHNGLRHMAGVLGALERQTFADCEVIVVDDASTDATAQWVAENHPRLRLIVNRRNQGFAASCNTGAAAARGRYVVMLNNDTEPESTWLAELARAIAANPEAAIVTSKLLLYDHRDTLHTTGDMLGADGVPRNRGVWEQDRGQYDGAVKIFSGCGGASAYRKDVWHALGGFDEDFWMYLEDVDLGFRARLLGCEAVFAPQARVYHRLSQSGGDTLASYYVGRNTIWLIAKNMPRSLLLRNAPQIASSQLRIALAALRNWRGDAARARLRGQWAGLCGLPQQLAKRRMIQPRRQLEDDKLAKLLAG
jgi:GT2 family glycosyltransferase